MKKLILLFTVTALFSYSNMNGQSVVQLTGLQSDHLETPTGIDNPNPRLSWKMEDSRPGAKQVSYRVLLDKDSMKVVNGNADIWDTGKVNSGDRLITYAGKQLEPFTKYYWKVIGGDLENKEVVSPVSSFETGMMDIKNWQGSWIGDGQDINYEPAPYFRKKFTTGKKIKLQFLFLNKSAHDRERDYEQMAKQIPFRKKTAAFFLADFYALEAVSIFSELGISIPDQIGIAGYDDILYARLAVPKLTTIRQDIREKAHLAADGLVKCLTDQCYTLEPENKLPVSLIIRQST